MEEAEELLRSILKSNQLLRLEDDKERAVYAGLLSHRVLRTAYDVFMEKERIDGTWDEFLDYCAQTPGIRAVALEILRSGIIDYTANSQFNFENAKAIIPNEADEILKAVQLCPQWYIEALVDIFLFTAETVFFAQLQKDRENYSWENYLEELRAKPEMWRRVLMAFREGLLKIDFARYWRKIEDVADDIV